jgi:pseudaminic acid synthase
MKNNPTINIAGREISAEITPYIIAEMSANHNGNIETAFKIIEEAKKAGADAIKLQTFTPETITLNSDAEDFRINGGLWDGRTLFELYKEAHLPWDWHKSLFLHALKHDITIFSTPFDNTAIDFLEDLNAPAYKIASFEVIDLELIKYAASTGKPLIISTGMANTSEIENAIDAAREGGCKELAILRCVSEYPAPVSDYNLRTIPNMIERYDIVTGLSDHTIDNTTAIVSVGMGASIIEKHFTLDRSSGGPDDIFSIEPLELHALCKDVKTAFLSLGKVDYSTKNSEMKNVKFRRSLYFIKDLKAGDLITPNSIKSVRPGYGLEPKYIHSLIGKKIKINVSKNTPVKYELIDW